MAPSRGGDHVALPLNPPSRPPSPPLLLGFTSGKASVVMAAARSLYLEMTSSSCNSVLLCGFDVAAPRNLTMRAELRLCRRGDFFPVVLHDSTGRSLWPPLPFPDSIRRNDRAMHPRAYDYAAPHLATQPHNHGRA
jgi:hypothetical protein